MNYLKILLFIFLIITSCKIKEKKEKEIGTVNSPKKEFVIAFGSCNNQNLPNNLWKEIKKNNPDVWIWGGDIIYTDTEDMDYMKQNYQKQKNNADYSDFIKNIDVLATWDDHDYGVNDGGAEYSKKAEAQQLFLDFFDIPATDKRRKQEGVYYAKDYTIGNENIKAIILDTRYFRTSLTPDTKTGKRFKPNKYGEGTMLGETQWNWLKDQLKNSKASYNIIVSSIQFLSCEHGFETWGNMPHEVDKLETILKETNAKNTIIISGDRHISEISKKEVEGLSYPLIDFTSSGLTHAYTSYKGEPNKYRVSNVVPKKSFGLLQFDFENNNVIMKIIGENNITYQTYTQRYHK
ncbi:alkaline phosphatase D family protein [Lutibacter sp. B1]|uniref:alkaline phosphatase D family protein n=1 Tax=Lutibacter sp. B1 TaxID=2725996 RepID=UPI0014575773|nr:alkaline phosphatase D family protein [Lutibacter sp. B1]NLP58398.1 alkaline phosphatase family protein [Lutibacter sp. B1]